MKDINETPATESSPDKHFSGIKIFFIVLAVAVVTSMLTVWLSVLYFFPKQFKPVELSKSESQTLAEKLDHLDPTTRSKNLPALKDDKTLVPEKYREDAASRHITFTERELNALLAQNTDLAEKVAIDLSDNLASAKLILPLDPDLPFLGGKILKLNAGLELRYENAEPVVKLRGISLWGVPLPNSWIGGIKNVDLVQEFGGKPGFWKSFSEGIEFIRVEDGKLSIQLKE
ncbi:MAG: hypothetical protein AMJ61_08350 [Desulfobacterales bacterium SG8_35_2]|nr:MAG: hypothetical protein AMJ61_08350 [Desulfobacterales bacterium SG8_35_2]